MVAKTFQAYEILGEPYEVNKRLYVRVRNPKTLNERVVRWYSEAEYRKMYPQEKVEAAATPDFKKILGFEKGYITIFKGINDLNEDWFQRCEQARYHVEFGWYIISTDEVPENLPDGVVPVQLPWEDVGEGINIKPKEQVRRAVEALLYAGSDSEFIGNIGDRLDLTLTVTNTIPLDTQYGHSTMHLFKDNDDNVYIWTTSAKTLTAGKTYDLKGSIKDQRIYKGVKQNIITRCVISKEY